ncbi:hypothetical protein Tco_0530789 [Tanacetum coccineum]
MDQRLLARALLNVDLKTFKAKLLQENIFVWNDAKYGPVRIHGGDYQINIVIKDFRNLFYRGHPLYPINKDIQKYYVVQGTDSFEAVNRMIEEDLKLSPGCTDSFEAVNRMIEEDLKLSPGCYQLTYNYLNKPLCVKTDRDWHYVALASSFTGYIVPLKLEVFPPSQTADEDECDEDARVEDFYDFDGFADYVQNNWVEDACDDVSGESMDLTTKESIISLNNGSTTFEQARAFINVVLKTFKAKLLQEEIFVWNDAKYGPVRIHGGDYQITIIIKDIQKYYAAQGTDSFKDIQKYYVVQGTDSFEFVNRMIERDLKEDLMLSPGCYQLTCNYLNKSLGKDRSIKTDRGWHNVVLASSFTGYIVHLKLEVFPSS